VEFGRLLLALYPELWCSRRGAFCEGVEVYNHIQ
jgi:hypothetical protein